jgi:hypothetical protein
MKSFIQSQELAFILEFIQEVVDFKEFIRGFQSTGAAILIGLGEIHLFKFYIDNDGWPVIRYKVSAVDAQWLSHNKPPICLWKKDDASQPRLPQGTLKPVPFKPM